MLFGALAGQAAGADAGRKEVSPPIALAEVPLKPSISSCQKGDDKCHNKARDAGGRPVSQGFIPVERTVVFCAEMIIDPPSKDRRPKMPLQKGERLLREKLPETILSKSNGFDGCKATTS